MKTLVWPDVHNRTELLKTFLAKNGDAFEKRIFLGDWFDQIDDNPSDALRVANLIVELGKDARNVFIEGNHDASYRYHTPFTICCGFSQNKLRAINKVMNEQDWRKFKLFEYEQGWLCSHAGVHPRIFEHPIKGLTLDSITELCKSSETPVKAGMYHRVYEMGKACGGLEPVGGINWLRWFQFKPIEGINQIVGHTTYDEPRVHYARKMKSIYKGETKEWNEYVDVHLSHFRNMPPNPNKICSWNWNIDNDNRYFAIIENGEVEIKLTLDYL